MSDATDTAQPRDRGLDDNATAAVARGEDTESSDVGFVVRFGPGAPLFDMRGLQVDLRDLLGCDVDVVPGDAEIYHRDNLLRDAIDL